MFEGRARGGFGRPWRAGRGADVIAITNRRATDGQQAGAGPPADAAAPDRAAEDAEKPGLIDRLRARYRWLDWLMAVNDRAGETGGGPAAAAIALAAFLSLFPLLVVGIAVVGYFSADDADFAARTVENLGLTGDAADTVLDAIEAAERNRQATTVLGLAGLAWSGLGVIGAVGAAVNSSWQAKGFGLKGRLRAGLWLVAVGALLIGSAGLAHLVGRLLPGPAVLATVAVTLAVDTVLFVSLFRVVTNVPVDWRAHLPGALVAAIGLGALKLISGVYLPRLVESSSLYGSVGVVLALLAWFMLLAKLVVYGAAVNVVSYEHGHGTVTAEIQVPRVAGQVPLGTTRGGAVDEPVTAS